MTTEVMDIPSENTMDNPSDNMDVTAANNNSTMDTPSTELTESQALEMATELAAQPTMTTTTTEEETPRLIITKMVRAANANGFDVCFV